MKTLNILIVEDQSTMMDVLCAYCDIRGKHAIRKAGDLAEARRALEEAFIPDLVISDGSLPDGKGPTLFPAYRQANDKVLILLLSGEEENVFQNHGADRFVLKSSGIFETLMAFLDKASES